MRDKITASAAPAPIGAYSQAIRANGFIFASGQIPVDPTTQCLAELQSRRNRFSRTSPTSCKLPVQALETSCAASSIYKASPILRNERRLWPLLWH
jgi:enamine deaminase RidA (YjgF/YER057c/UK114 family)